MSGRPSLYSAELADSICERVALGDNLNKLCDLDEFPCQDTVYRWLRNIPEFSEKYAQAREARADARSDRIDDYRNQVISGDMLPEVARVVFDMEKWQAGKENAKRYGEKVQNEHSGTIGVTAESDEEIAKRFAAKLNGQPS